MKHITFGHMAKRFFQGFILGLPIFAVNPSSRADDVMAKLVVCGFFGVIAMIYGAIKGPPPVDETPPS